jgi:hypothetical protein
MFGSFLRAVEKQLASVQPKVSWDEGWLRNDQRRHGWRLRPYRRGCPSDALVVAAQDALDERVMGVESFESDVMSADTDEENDIILVMLGEMPADWQAEYEAELAKRRIEREDKFARFAIVRPREYVQDCTFEGGTCVEPTHAWERVKDDIEINDMPIGTCSWCGSYGRLGTMCYRRIDGQLEECGSFM